MAIFIPADLTTYFNGAIATADLELLIFQVQQLIESTLVANRRLEITKYVECRKLSDQILLSYTPLIDDSTNYPITIETRCRGLPWQPFTNNVYYDFDRAEINLSICNYYDFGRSFNHHRYYGVHPNRYRHYPEVRITYYSGIDLSDTTLNANFIAAFVNIINYLNDSSANFSPSTSGTNSTTPPSTTGVPAGQILKRFKLDEHYEVEYFGSEDSGGSTSGSNSAGASLSGKGNLNDLLAYFCQFKPRRFST